MFSPELGALKGTTATIRVDSTAQPRFHKPRAVPYALKAKIEKELDRLIQQGVIEPTEFSEWAAPIVPVLKKMAQLGYVETTRLLLIKLLKWTATPCLE